MDRRFEFEAAAAARKPIVFAFSDGREYTFPGDVSADSWLAFMAQWADFLEGDVLPARVIEPMYRTVMGDETFDELRKELTWTEMMQVATMLWKEYSGATPHAESDGDADPVSPSPELPSTTGP